MSRTNSRKAILDAFTDLVARNGYDDASLSAVAEIVGVSKGTVVHHFGTKDQILKESHQLYIERRLREIHAILEVIERPENQLCAMVFCLLRAHRDDRAATIAFLREFDRFASSNLVEPSRNLRNEYADILSSIVQRGTSSGTFDDVDIRLTTLQIFGMCNYAWTWYRPDGEASPEQISSVFCRNILTGLLRDKQTSTTNTVGGAALPDSDWFEQLGPFLEHPYPSTQ
jgi:AcrR family transcriptional regulator